MTPHRLRVAALACLLVAVTGCGLPPDGTSATIPPEELPYGLEQTQARPTTPAGTPSLASGPVVWWSRDNLLLPVAPLEQVSQSQDARVVVEALLARLANGPSDSDIAAGYGTALDPTMTLRLVRVSNGVATVDLDPGRGGQGGTQLPLTVGQIVLTVASAPGVSSVQLVHDDRPLTVPLPGGVLTTRSLSPQDYFPLVGQLSLDQGEITSTDTGTTAP